MKGFKTFGVNACPNDLVILTRKYAGNTIHLDDYFETPKAVCSDFAGITVWCRGLDQERIFETLKHYVPKGCKRLCCTYYDEDGKFHERQFEEKVRLNMANELRLNELVLCGAVPRFEEGLKDYIKQMGTNGEEDDSFQDNYRIKEGNESYRPGKIRLDRAGHAVSYLDVTHTILPETRNAHQERPSASSTFRDRTAQADLSSLSTSRGRDPTFNPEEIDLTRDNEQSTRQGDSHVTSQEVRDIVSETLGDIPSILEKVETIRRSMEALFPQVNRNIVVTTTTPITTLSSIFVSSAPISVNLAAPTSSSAVSSALFSLNLAPLTSSVSTSITTAATTSPSNSTAIVTTTITTRIITTGSQNRGNEYQFAQRFAPAINDRNERRNMLTGNNRVVVTTANDRASITSSVGSEQSIDLLNDGEPYLGPELTRIPVTTDTPSPLITVVGTRGSNTMTTTSTQHPRMSVSEAASRSSTFTSTPFNERRVQFAGGDGAAGLMQTDGSDSPISLEEQSQNQAEGDTQSGRYSAEIISSDETEDRSPSLTSLASGENHTNTDGSSDTGEHHTVFLAGDLTMLVSSIREQPDLTFNWISMTEYRLFTTDSRLFILIENKDEDDFVAPAFHEFPDSETTETELMDQVLKSVKFLTRSQAKEKFQVKPVYRVVLNDARFPSEEDSLEMRYFREHMVVTAAFSNKFIKELINIGELSSDQRMISEDMPEGVTEKLASLFRDDTAQAYKVNYAKMLIKISRILELFHFDMKWQGIGNHMFSRSNMTRKVEVRAFDPTFNLLEERELGLEGLDRAEGQGVDDPSYKWDGYDTSHLRWDHHLKSRAAHRERANTNLDESRFPPEENRNSRGSTGLLARGSNFLSSVVATPIQYLGSIYGYNSQVAREDTPFPVSTTTGGMPMVTTAPPMTTSSGAQ